MKLSPVIVEITQPNRIIIAPLSTQPPWPTSDLTTESAVLVRNLERENRVSWLSL